MCRFNHTYIIYVKGKRQNYIVSKSKQKCDYFNVRELYINEQMRKLAWNFTWRTITAVKGFDEEIDVSSAVGFSHAYDDKDELLQKLTKQRDTVAIISADFSPQ